MARANTGTLPASPRLCQVSAVCSSLRDEHNHPQPATVTTPAVPHPQASWQVCKRPLRLWRHALGQCSGSGLDSHTSIRRRPEGFGAQLCSQSGGGALRPLVFLLAASLPSSMQGHAPARPPTRCRLRLYPALSLGTLSSLSTRTSVLTGPEVSRGSDSPSFEVTFTFFKCTIPWF